MNNKGFSLIEFLGCMALLGIILCMGLYCARGTLATSLSTLTDVSTNEIYSATETYLSENKIIWTNEEEEYTCLTVKNLVDAGYFSDDEVDSYKDDEIRVVRDSVTKVIDSIRLVDSCK